MVESGEQKVSSWVVSMAAKFLDSWFQLLVELARFFFEFVSLLRAN